MNALLKAIAQRRTASTQPAAAPAPQRLSTTELAQVAGGGAPRGTWSVADSASTSAAPRGTW